jgi:hypothetical protein
MFKKIANAFRKLRRAVKINHQVKRVAEVAVNPEHRLEFLRAGYRKFSPTLTGRERAKMKKEIKRLERTLKRARA